MRGRCASCPSFWSRWPTSAGRKCATRWCSSARRGCERKARCREYYEDARTLARLLTEWADQFTNSTYRFVVCSGGGPGIMEAANRGAAEANGKTVGLNIGLPFEQFPNPYITPELSFEFHYFFMRKFWFAYLAKALVVFPGGFGTLDEMMELLTLSQTQKLAKKITIVLYGSKYWKEIINFDALVRYGMISPEDLNLFQYADDPQTAFELLKAGLTTYAMRGRDARDAGDFEIQEPAETGRARSDGGPRESDVPPHGGARDRDASVRAARRGNGLRRGRA